MLENPTIDEVVHLPAGLTYWEKGTFRLYHHNPPLIKLVAALPVLASGVGDRPPLSERLVAVGVPQQGRLRARVRPAQRPPVLRALHARPPADAGVLGARGPGRLRLVAATVRRLGGDAQPHPLGLLPERPGPRSPDHHRPRRDGARGPGDLRLLALPPAARLEAGDPRGPLPGDGPALQVQPGPLLWPLAPAGDRPPAGEPGSRRAGASVRPRGRPRGLDPRPERPDDRRRICVREGRHAAGPVQVRQPIAHDAPRPRRWNPSLANADLLETGLEVSGQPVPGDLPGGPARPAARALSARFRRAETRRRRGPQEVLRSGTHRPGRRGDQRISRLPRRRAPPEELEVVLSQGPGLQGARGDVGPGRALDGRPGAVAAVAREPGSTS